MTKTTYVLNDGTELNTLAEALASGQQYHLRFTEQPHREYLDDKKEEARLKAIAADCVRHNAKLHELGVAGF